YPKIHSDFSIDTVACAPYDAQFNNLSFGGISSYVWNFGDGASSIAANPKHVFDTSKDTIYDVSLIVVSMNNCKDTSFQNIRVYPKPLAAINVVGGSSGCAPFDVLLENNSQNATSYHWDFGDGSISDTSAINLNHSYDN